MFKLSLFKYKNINEWIISRHKYWAGFEENSSWLKIEIIKLNGFNFNKKIINIIEKVFPIPHSPMNKILLLLLLKLFLFVFFILLNKNAVRELGKNTEILTCLTTQDKKKIYYILKQGVYCIDIDYSKGDNYQFKSK